MHRVFNHQTGRFLGMALDQGDLDVQARINAALAFLEPKLSAPDMQRVVEMFSEAFINVAEDDEATPASVPIAIPGGRQRQAMDSAFVARHADAGRIGHASTVGDQPLPRTRPDGPGFERRHPDVARIKTL